MASIHGTYRKVEETIPALKLLAEFLNAAKAGPITVLLDSPVSNSGRLKSLIAEVNDWKVELLSNPDPLLAASDQIIVTADSVILDSAKRWVNLAREIISKRLPQSWIVDLSIYPD